MSLHENAINSPKQVDVSLAPFTMSIAGQPRQEAKGTWIVISQDNINKLLLVTRDTASPAKRDIDKQDLTPIA
jgi:hypothetical protein